MARALQRFLRALIVLRLCYTFSRVAFQRTFLLPRRGRLTSSLTSPLFSTIAVFPVMEVKARFKGGQVLGKTDELGFNVLEDKITVHDLHATILYCLGFDHTKLTYRHQGRDFRLTDVEGEVVQRLFA